MGKLRKGTDISANRLDKAAEKQKRSKVYSTEKIKEILNDKTGNMDMDPFWHGQFDYREAGLSFEYTDEELEELDKCSMDCLYFAENYAKFKNDKGLTLVKLRDYQIRLLKLFGEEKYIKELDIIAPKTQKICIMQSRQTGKCVKLNTKIKIFDQNNTILNFDQLNKQKYDIKRIIWQKLKKCVQSVELYFQMQLIKLTVLLNVKSKLI